MSAGNRSSILGDVKVDIEQKEHVVSECPISASQIQRLFETLRDLNAAQMDQLNKSMRRKIDWRLMPTIRIMFLMN